VPRARSGTRRRAARALPHLHDRVEPNQRRRYPPRERRLYRRRYRGRARISGEIVAGEKQEGRLAPALFLLVRIGSDDYLRFSGRKVTGRLPCALATIPCSVPSAVSSPWNLQGAMFGSAMLTTRAAVVGGRSGVS